MLNLPNILTLCRIALVILFTAVLAVDGVPRAEINSVTGGWFSPISTTACIALWAFVVAAITDFLDGYLARKYNLITDFGKLMDPLADKILVCAAFIYLTYAGMCPFWVTIIIIFREFLVTGLRQIAVSKGCVIAADWCGKWKTGAQLGFCIACLVPLAPAENGPAASSCGSVYCSPQAAGSTIASRGVASSTERSDLTQILRVRQYQRKRVLCTR